MVRKNSKTLTRNKPKKIVKRKTNKTDPKTVTVSTYDPDDLAKRYIAKIKSGRPTKYRKDMCYRAIKLFAQGRSKNSVYVHLCIDQKTFDSWCTEFNEDGTINHNFKKDFLLSVKIGECLTKEWWMEIGRCSLGNKDFNVGLYMIHMANRFGWSRKDKLEIDAKTEHTDKKVVEINFNYDQKEVIEIIMGALDYGIVKPSQLSPPA